MTFSKLLGLTSVWIFAVVLVSGQRQVSLYVTCYSSITKKTTQKQQQQQKTKAQTTTPFL